MSATTLLISIGACAGSTHRPSDGAPEAPAAAIQARPGRAGVLPPFRDTRTMPTTLEARLVYLAPFGDASTTLRVWRSGDSVHAEWRSDKGSGVMPSLWRPVPIEREQAVLGAALERLDSLAHHLPPPLSLEEARRAQGVFCADGSRSSLIVMTGATGIEFPLRGRSRCGPASPAETAWAAAVRAAVAPLHEPR